MKRLGKFIKSNTKLFIGFILGAIIFGSVGAVVAGTVASSEITYTSNGQTTVQGALNDLYQKAKKIDVYENYFDVEDTDILEVGDKVNCVINGMYGTISEWVVIKSGSNPEMIAKTQTPNDVSVSSYEWAIENLQSAAATYKTSFVQSARNFGYSNQILICPSFEDCPSDTGYEPDAALVRAALGTLSTGTDYFVSSRMKYDTSNNSFIRHVISDYDQITAMATSSSSLPIRPILTLKSDVKFVSTSTANTYDLIQ